MQIVMLHHYPRGERVKILRNAFTLKILDLHFTPAGCSNCGTLFNFRPARLLRFEEAETADVDVGALFKG